MPESTDIIYMSDILLPRDPQGPYHAATKGYVDAGLSGKAAGSHTHAAGEVTGLGTAALVNTGTQRGEIPVLSVNGKLSESVLPPAAFTDIYTCEDEEEMLSSEGRLRDSNGRAQDVYSDAECPGVAQRVEGGFIAVGGGAVGERADRGGGDRHTAGRGECRGCFGEAGERFGVARSAVQRDDYRGRGDECFYGDARAGRAGGSGGFVPSESGSVADAGEGGRGADQRQRDSGEVRGRAG